MRLTKENSFLAAYPRQSRNNLIFGTPYNSKGAVTRVLATAKSYFDTW